MTVKPKSALLRKVQPGDTVEVLRMRLEAVRAELVWAHWWLKSSQDAVQKARNDVDALRDKEAEILAAVIAKGMVGGKP